MNGSSADELVLISGGSTIDAKISGSSNDKICLLNWSKMVKFLSIIGYGNNGNNGD